MPQPMPGVTVRLIAALFLLILPTSALAQTAADLFDDRVLHEVRLLVNSRDLRLLRTRWQENTYYAADMIWQGRKIRNVAIRSRGTGSRNPTKLGLKVDFDRYTKNQRFLGLKELILDNLWQDPSLIREAMAMAVFRRMGQHAPRESFAKLYINNEYQGLYALVEPIDTVFLQRTQHESAGYLFEYRYVRPFYTEYLGDDLAPYAALFQPQNHEDDPQEELYGPIRDLFRDVNAELDATWRQRVEARIDLPHFMTHLAIQGFMAENDGILGYAGLNNFYLYRFAGTERHQVIPWDEDYAFTFADSSLFRHGDMPVVLFERAFGEADLRSLFLDVAERCALTITGDGWLSSELDRIVGLIAFAALTDTRKQFSNEEFVSSIEFLRAFAAARTDLVLTEVALWR